MDAKKAGVIVVAGLVAASTVPVEFDKPHIDILLGHSEDALMMDGAIISTHTGTAPTLGDWVKRYPGRKDFI
jgi:hypothetical protein